MDSFPVECLNARLVTGLAVKGGGRGSLTRCAGRLAGLKRALAAADEDDEEKPVVAAQELSTELQLARIELTKLYLLAQRQEFEAEGLEESAISQEAIAAEQQRVQNLRQDLQHASKTVAAKAEYEQTAKLLISQYPTPTHELEKEIQQLKAELQQARQASQEATQQMNLRRSQFHLLLQCIGDLKASLEMDKDTGLFMPITEEKQTSTDSEKPPSKKPKQTVDEQESNAATKINSSEDVVMADAKAEEDEEGALYDDLDI